MATIGFLRYNGLPQVIDKSFTKVRDSISGSFRQPYSLMNPSVTLTGNFESLFLGDDVNYIVTSDGENSDGQHINPKYYFITDYEFTHNNVTILHLHLDVLTTYKREINTMNVILDRSENAIDGDLPDNMLPISSNYDVEKIRFPVSIDETRNLGTYVLITSQNGYTPV